MPLDAWTIALLTVASFLAAFFDAIVGGGGLITIPALLAALPATTPIPTVLGTNKVVAGIGTTVAASRFLRRGIVSWREVISPVVASMFGAAIGVQLSYLLDPKILRPLILVMLCGMLLFTIFKPTLGQAQQPRLNKTATNVAATGIAFILGLYDGFFGPGTGSLLIFLFVAILGFDFLRASAMAKSVNWASNISRTGLKSGCVARNSIWERNEECERKNRRCILRDTLRIFSRSMTKLQPQIEFRSSRNF